MEKNLIYVELKNFDMHRGTNNNNKTSDKFMRHKYKLTDIFIHGLWWYWMKEQTNVTLARGMFVF